MFKHKAIGWDGFHDGCVIGLLISEAFKVESFLDEHGVELRPCDDSFLVIICFLEESLERIVHLDIPEGEVSLPGFEMLEALRDKFVECQLVIAIFEGILEEPENVLVDVDCQVGG